MTVYSTVYMHVQIVACPCAGECECCYIVLDVLHEHFQSRCAIGLRVSGCLYVDTLCMYVRSRSSSMQHYIVRPVLKHGPRSLTYVQVRSREYSVHNKCNTVSYIYCGVPTNIYLESLSKSLCIRTRKVVNYASEW